MFGIWWPVLLCSFMVYFISWCLLICFFCSFLFIHVHLFSCLFIFSHFVSVLFIFFLFLPFSVFSWKNITNLNHLHVDPRLSSAAKPVISAKSIPTAPMDPISCPSDFFGRRIRRITSEDIRSVPKCAEVLTFVESTCLQCLPNHSQRNGSHRKGPVLHWAIQLWMSILNLFTSSLSRSIKQCLGEALASLLAFSIYFILFLHVVRHCSRCHSCFQLSQCGIAVQLSFRSSHSRVLKARWSPDWQVAVQRIQGTMVGMAGCFSPQHFVRPVPVALWPQVLQCEKPLLLILQCCRLPVGNIHDDLHRRSSYVKP